MSAEDFQLIDSEKLDKSNIKRGFTKLYHQHGAQIDNENQSTNVFSGKFLTMHK